MTRRNRVDPWGDLHAMADRGLLTGNRGCLVDDAGTVVRHHRSTTLWITCVLTFRDRRHPLAAPRHWTPIFFLDEAVALAAGHRPCAFCRRDDYRAFREGVTGGRGETLRAAELDRRLTGERLRRGRGIERATDRRTWTSPAALLPDAAVIVRAGVPHVVRGDVVRPFGFGGWGRPAPRPTGPVEVLTPPTSVAALTGGFRPLLHPSA